jgi:mono/diheme cytochrome c family protein
MNKKIIFIVLILFALAASSWLIGIWKSTIDFTTQVKPIINKNCITCHGGVKQKGGFSLLFREEALAKTKSGKQAIIPGDPGNSEMIRRLTLKDPEERMPYKHDALSKDDIAILSTWIKQGAAWGQHWAYVPVKEVIVPQAKSFFGLFNKKSDWAKNEVDDFIEQKLIAQDLKPSPQADKKILLRRVSLDLIGMPAPENVAHQFLQDSTTNAYGNLVDSLLASPHYGEKWTSMWLDLARYADTKGYEADMGRNIWKYRDWLIKNFNADKPYNQFLVEQIAGDLLPDATDDDYIATAFHRNSMTNDEGGTDNEEFRTAAVLDRVNTTWQGLMGTSFACVQCHSHPYDPFKHEEYYKFLAFFNNARDEDSQADYPLLRQYSGRDSATIFRLTKWIGSNVSADTAKNYYTFLKTWQPTINSLQCNQFVNAALVSSWYAGMRNNGSCRLQHVDLSNKDELLFRYQSGVKNGVWTIHTDSLNGPVLTTIQIAPVKDGWKIANAKIKPTTGFHDLYFRYKNTSLKTQEQTGILFEWFCFKETFPGKGKQGYDSAYSWFWQLMNAKVTTTPVMYENPPDMHRTSYIFNRGNWLVKGDAVEPDVPKSLNPFPANAPKNRLGLAMWLTAEQNPLTARTMVNRIWEQLFGNGLAETLEDLGSQGISPTHVELLDWLSYQFMHQDKWSIKKLIRTIVMSAAYQQDSKLTPELQQKDPYNKLYARGSRVRLSAEQVRDQSLSMSGLLNPTIYGPSVYPWQPNGIWLSPWNGEEWQPAKGHDQYRRALYTYWKRSAPYPSMMTFDGVAREVCTARRIRTNTPLQALTTLNDSAYIDIARNFAYRMQALAAKDVREQIKKGFQLATMHEIDANSLKALLNLYNTALNKLKKDEEKTCELIGAPNEHNNPETAALTVVANALLNLDEVVTKN